MTLEKPYGMPWKTLAVMSSFSPADERYNIFTLKFSDVFRVSFGLFTKKR